MNRLAARLAALTVVLLSAPARAQYRFDHWTAANGLPQNSVRDIVQTRDGYLWLTTYDGLVRFDGVRFTVFNRSNSPGLPGNRFVDLFEDRSGNLWASLENGDVVRWERGRFAFYPHEERTENADDELSTLGEDGQGNVVVSYLHWEYQRPENVLTRIGSRVYRLRGNRREPAAELGRTFLSREVQEESLGGSVTELLDGELWICTPDRILRFAGDGHRRVYDQKSGLFGARPRLVRGPGLPLRALSRDEAGHLWLTELESGKRELLSTQSPDGLDVLRGYADTEGNFWFSTYNDGLFRARRQTVTPFGKAQGLDVKEVYPILETRDGSLWIGATDLFRFKDGAFTRHPLPESSPAMVNSLYEDRDGQLWVNGALRFMDGQFVRAPWTAALPDTKYLACATMCEDGGDGFWVGTGLGVACHRAARSAYYTTRDGLAGNDVKVIIEDGAGGLWLGGHGGLTHFKDGTFTVWTEKDGLPGDTVRALKRDADGTLWIGTYDSGLGRFKDGRFTTYTVKDGLFDNGVFQMLEDDAGWLWMSCNRGLYRVRKQELDDFAEGRIKSINSLAYNENDGMVSSECNGGRWPAGVRDRSGRLWFPTMGGVAMIDPARMQANTHPPPVVIEEMRIDNEAAPFDAWDRAVHDPSSAIRILPGQDNFEIQYTALSFINSDHMRFRYRLEGTDEAWVEAGTRRAAYFSHLSPGQYTFRVIAANADGVWNQEGARVRITVVPPFWRTWWFLTLSALGVAGVVAGAWGYREAHLRRIRRAQEEFARQLIASQESERKRVAGELHDSLGQNLVIIRNWAMLGASQLDQSAPAREELDEINAIASRSIGEVREIAYNLGPYHLERLGFEKSLRDMVTRVAKASGVAITAELDPLGGALTGESEMSLYRIAQEALNNVVKHSQATEARVRLTLEAANVRLVVADNGRGFLTAQGPPSSGFGLNGMAERVRLLGGTLSIRSAPGEGTTVEALLPGRHDQPAERGQ